VTRENAGRTERDSLVDGDPAESDRGAVSLAPTDDVVAGTYNTWTVTYTVGRLGMDDGSTLRVAASQTADWGTPQFDDPAADNYATVETSGDATLSASYETKAYVRPFNSVVEVGVSDGSLAPGETITLTLGDTSGGSMGHRA